MRPSKLMKALVQERRDAEKARDADALLREALALGEAAARAYALREDCSVGKARALMMCSRQKGRRRSKVLE